MERDITVAAVRTMMNVSNVILRSCIIILYKL